MRVRECRRKNSPSSLSTAVHDEAEEAEEREDVTVSEDEDEADERER